MSPFSSDMALYKWHVAWVTRSITTAVAAAAVIILGTPKKCECPSALEMNDLVFLSDTYLYISKVMLPF